MSDKSVALTAIELEKVSHKLKKVGFTEFKQNSEDEGAIISAGRPLGKEPIM